MPKNEWLPIWESRPYPPLLMSLVIDSTVFGFKKIFPKSQISRGASLWQNQRSNYLYLDSELDKTIRELYHLALKNPAGFLRFFKIAYQKSKSFNRRAQKLSAKLCRGYSDKDLIKSLKIFPQVFFDFYSYATVAAWFGYKQDNPLYEKMNEILRRKTQNQPGKFADYLVALTNPPKLLKTSQQEKEILLLAARAKKLGLKRPGEIKKRLAGELNEIFEKYKTLSFDFTDKLGWNLSYFAVLTAEKLKEDIPAKIEAIDNYEKDAAKSFARVCRELNLKKEEIKIFNLIRNVGYYKWLREYEFQEGLYYFQAIPNELGKRCGLGTLAAKYVLPGEWENFLKNPKQAKNTVKARQTGSLYLSQWQKKPVFLSGSQAKRAYEKIKLVKSENKSNSGEIKGTPAYSGKAKGRVKIINRTSDLKKMSRGDILVSLATSPDLLSAMKKAVAIVTDEGGITCHAAIVSRELKIPCVVGAKIATKVLKDGDLVEVDANKGVVRKLK